MPPERNIFVVVATNRHPTLDRFFDEWSAEFAETRVQVVVVEDAPHKSTPEVTKDRPFPIQHFAWEEIDTDLGRDAWIIPRRSSGIKSYGILKAYQQGAETIVVLDDDCRPTAGRLVGFPTKPVIATHRANLFDRVYSEPSWTSSIDGLRPRGLPYEALEREVRAESVMLSHGLWAHVPDLNARTQLEMSSFPHVSEYFVEQLVRRDSFIPICGMNLAWKRELTPTMYFMLMGCDRNDKPWGHHRFDDIWAGLNAKKILDHLGLRMYSGHPVVWHDRASDASANLKREASGIVANEEFSRAVDEVRLTSTAIRECFGELAERLPVSGEYWDRVKQAMTIWSRLF